MRAARIGELGGAPTTADVDAPEAGDGRAVVEVTAAALNPIDLNVAAGRFYGGHPPFPYTPGSEAVGRVLEAPSLQPGTRVYVSGGGLGVARDGTLAEHAAAEEADAYPLPDGVDDASAAAAGTAGIAGWMSTTWRAQVGPGDRVVVLGATGTVGTVCIQAAKLRGAERVVAVGRDEQRLERARSLGADAVVRLGDGDLGAALRDACSGEGFTVCIDMLWSAVVAEALAVAVPQARVVNVGQSAGPEAPLKSNDVRGKELNVLGYSNFTLTPDTKRQGYLELVKHIAAGDVRIETETFGLDAIAEAWERAGSGAKVVVTP